MKQIELIRGFKTLVDDDDFKWLNQWNWFASLRDGRCYAARIIKNRNKRTTLYLHRLLLKIGSGKQVDHINGNGLDNRKKNLRICTHNENARNRKLNKNSRTGVKGVTFIEKTRRYQSSITVNGKLIYLGKFKTLEEAAEKYRKTAREKFGEFVRD